MHFLLDETHSLLEAIFAAIVVERFSRRFRDGRAAQAPAAQVIELPFIESRTKVFAPELVA